MQSEGSVSTQVLSGFPGPVDAAADQAVSIIEFRTIEMHLPVERRAGERRSGRTGWVASHGPDAIEAAERKAQREQALKEAGRAARAEGFAQGEKAGMQQARLEMETEMNAAAARERERLVAAVKEFEDAQATYFARIEQEVVKLALSIAARVLHREAKLDPLLLTGVVRVALEKMAAGGGGVILRAPAEDSRSWEGMFAATDAAQRPTIVGDAAMARGECRLETTMGTVELGVAAQLEEIEKGFYDLLEHRPVRR